MVTNFDSQRTGKEFMIRIRKFVSELLLGFSLSIATISPVILPLGVAGFAVSQTACKETDLDKMAKASRELAGDVVTGEKVVATVFTGGLISITQKDRFADYFKSIAIAGASYNAMVKDFSEQAKNGTLPTNALQLLAAEFDKVVTPFLQLLDDLGKLSANASTQISLGVAALKAAVVAIAVVMANRGSKTAKRNVHELGMRGVYV